MASSSDMNVALRFQADVSQARAELKTLNEAVRDVGKTPQVDVKSIDNLGSSAKQASVDTHQLADAYARGSQTIVAAIQQMTAQMASMSQGAKRSTSESSQAVNQSTKSIISNIQRQLAAMEAGGTGTEKYFRSLQKIQSQTGDLPTWLNKLAAAEAVAALQMDKSTISAKQLAAANRMLPAQMTDITVGLATGQSPFTVALQQGGQLKDMYGGIAPAAKAVSGAVMGMVSPFTLAAAGVGVLTAAWLSGRHEQEAYTRSIITTGNAAGTSVGKLTVIAQAVGEVTGSYGKASDAAAGLAATGKVSNDVIAQAAMATTAWARSTDTDVSAMVQSFAALGEKPAEASRKLNEQYNYLTTAVYQQIKALEEQGRKDDAAALAQRTYAAAMKDRADEVKAQLNGLGKSAQWVGNQFSSMWHSISNIGRVTPLTEQLAEAQKEYRRLLDAGKTGDVIPHALGFTSYDSTAEARARVMKRMADLQQQIGAETRKAEADAKRAADADAGIKATDDWDKRAKSLRNWKEQLADVVKDIKAQGKLLGKSDKEIQDQIDRETEKLTPKTPKGAGPKVNPVDTAFQTQLQTLQQARAQAEQGLANAQDNVGSSTDQATAKLGAWLAENKNALKLDEARIAKLREVAAETDRLHKATKDLQDTKARNERITQGLAAVDESISQAQGRTAEAAVTRIEERFRKLRDDLGKTGNLSGLAKVDQLVGIESARAQLETLQQQADRIFSDQSRTEQSLANQVTAGLTGELEAKRQILNINTSTAAQVEALLPKMRELAEITGNPAAIDRVKDLEVRIQGLRTKANEVSQAFGNAFGNSLSNSLKSLADGTATLGEAVRGLLSNLATGMGEWAAQQLALRAQEGVMGLINGAGTAAAGAGAAEAVGATATSTAITAASAAGAASMGAGISSGGSLAALEMSTAIATAGAAAAQAIAAAMAAASAGQASSGIASAVGAVAGSFSSGGWTGPGSKYQYAGVVHADEFVHRQEVVRQPGALAFLTRFNQVGMAALNDWLPYADGGLVVGAGASLGIPSMGNFKPAAPAMGGSTKLDNQQNFYLVDDPDRIAQVLSSSKGEKAM
ncbi:phage tail length tape measure family protein, partial [Comamonas testosteroni]|uniref:phage tail length tape measure family protein n=1 Tax=Comamonas testosteroni TaxID=285 RepID=UPI0011ECC417